MASIRTLLKLVCKQKLICKLRQQQGKEYLGNGNKIHTTTRLSQRPEPIDAASQKGMFTGDQLSAIGSMRDRFMAELKEQAPAEDNVATIEEPDTAALQ